MIIGIPKEIKQQEFRVALPPSAAYQLSKRGHQVLVEAGAGAGEVSQTAITNKPGRWSSRTTWRFSQRPT